MTHMARRISLDTIPSSQIGLAAQGPWNGIATHAQAPAWVVCATDYQADAAALRYLTDAGFDARSYLVQTQQPALGKRPAYIRTEPAFPGYLLIRLGPDDPRHLIRKDSRNGVEGLLSAVGSQAPAILPDAAVLVLIDMAEANRHAGYPILGRIDDGGRLRPIPRPNEPVPDWTDQTLTVVDHPFASGLTGTCIHSGRDRVILLLELLGGTRRVELSRSAVRPT